MGPPAADPAQQLRETLLDLAGFALVQGAHALDELNIAGRTIVCVGRLRDDAER